MNQINIAITTELAADKVSALEPSYDSVKHLAVLMATVTDPSDNTVITLNGPAVPVTQVNDTLHSLLSKAADALREKYSAKAVV